MASVETVDKILALLIRTKPGMDRTMDGFQETVAAWHLALEPIPDEVVWRAAVILSRSDKPFVPAGEVFQTALDLLDREPSAEDAWKTVQQWARQGDEKAFALSGRTLLALNVMPPRHRREAWNDRDLPHLRRAFEAEYGRLTEKWRKAAAMGEGRLLTDGKG